MWGGTPDRNMVSNMKGLPTDWDVKTKKNVKWVAELGSQSYGNPVVAGGMVFVGTNNEGLRDPKQAGDRGVLMAFREVERRVPVAADAREAGGRPRQRLAVSGRRLVAAGRGRRALYYTSNRGVVWCLDINGFRDGKNDGPVTDEKLTGQNDADVIWSFDMMEEVGSYPHNLSNSSPVISGDLIFVSTSNGQDESHVNIPSPRAPAIIALNKNTGKLVWEDNSVEDRILHGQWSTPSVGTIGGVDQVVQRAGRRLGARLRSGHRQEALGVRHQPEGLGLAEDAQRGDRDAGDLRGQASTSPTARTRSTAKASATSTAIDATKRGDITKTGRVWHFDKIRRSISTASIADGLLYIPDFSGFLHCLDAKTGQEYWTHDMFAAVWGSTLVVDGKVYLGDEDGDIVVLQAGKEKKVLGRDEHGQRRLRDAGAGARRAVPEQPESAVRAGAMPGRNDTQHGMARLQPSCDRRPEGSRCDLSSCLRVFVAAAVRAAAGGADAGAGRELAPVPRQRRASPASRPTAPPGDADAASGPTRPASRSNRPPRSSTAPSTSDRRRANCSRSISRPASCAGSTRPGERVHRRVVAGRRRRRGVHRRPRRHPSTPSTVQDGRKRSGRSRPTARSKSSPVLVDDLVLIGSYDTHLYALERRTGKLRWKVQTDGPVHATPAVHERRRLHRPAATSSFRAVRVADGKALFEIPIGAYTGASPVVEGDRAYFGTFDADVLALDLTHAQGRVDATAIPSGSSRTTRRPRSLRRRPRDRRRPRQGGARDRRRQRQGARGSS